MGSAARTTALWAAAAIGAGVLALGAGASGLLGSPVGQGDFDSPIVAPVDGVALLDCPGGEQVGVAARNDRLYVVARTADADWLAVRSVDQGYRTVWVPLVSIRSDQYPLSVHDLPELSCG